MSQHAVLRYSHKAAGYRTINLVNRRACEVLGREVDEILGKRFESFVPDPDREGMLEQVLTMRISAAIGIVATTQREEKRR